jgi:thiamine biosynthesis protein ThiS
VITVNGTTHSFVEEQTLEDLLCKLKVANQICAIEVNKVLIPHKERSEYEIQEEDNIEIVSLVGGG